jgi:hypothetical protein
MTTKKRRATAQPGPDRVILSNGIALRIRPVPRGAIRRALQAVEIDPESPAEGSVRRLEVAIQLYIVLGTQAASVPGDMYAPEEDGWLDDLEGAGVPVDRALTGMARYREWLEAYALSGPDNMVEVYRQVLQVTGVIEQEIIDAVRAVRETIA